jgi:hypothetical protein
MGKRSRSRTGSFVSTMRDASANACKCGTW